jgi:excisionase family DNA binding protein
VSALAEEIKAALREVLREELPRLAAGLPLSREPSRIGVPEAATLANRHPDTVRRAIKAGRLHAMKPEGAREWILDGRDVDRWIRGERQAPPTDVKADVESALARALDGKLH